MCGVTTTKNTSESSRDTPQPGHTSDVGINVTLNRPAEIDRALIDPTNSPLLSQLLYFPNQELQGHRGDLFVAPDMLINDYQKGEVYPISKCGPAAASCFAGTLYRAYFTLAWEDLGLQQAFKEERRIAVVSAHGANWSDGIWRYKLIDECRLEVREMLSELDKLNYELIYLFICNQSSDTISLKNTPVIQFMTPPDGKMIYVRREPESSKN